MALAGTQTYTDAETRKLIHDVMQAKGDHFRVRVLRRKNSGGVEVIAFFEEAKAEHIAAPEKWLPDLAGGGNYVIHVMHESSGLDTIGDGIPFSVDNTPSHPVDFNMVQSADWSGPLAMTFPKRARGGGTVFQASSVSGVGYSELGQEGGSTPVGARVLNDRESEGWNKAQMFERQLNDLRRNAEVAEVRREAAERVKSMENMVSKLSDEIRSLRTEAQKPHESMVETLGKIIGPLVPVFQAIIAGQNDLRVKMLEQQAATAAANLASAREQGDKFEKLLMHLSQRPPMDPAVQMFLEHLKTQSDNPAKGLLTDVIGAISGMSNAAMQVMTTAMDVGLGGDRGGTGEIVREVAGAAGSFFQMMTEQKQQERQQMAPGFAPQQRLPAARAQVLQQPRPGQQPQQPPPPAIAVLNEMVTKHHDPQVTANFFLNSLSRDEDIRARFAAAGNDIEPFFQKHWGAWALQNPQFHGPYVLALRDAVEAGAKARGWEQAAPAQPAPQQPQAPQRPQMVRVAPAQNGGQQPGFAGVEPAEDEVPEGDEEDEQDEQPDDDAA